MRIISYGSCTLAAVALAGGIYSIKHNAPAQAEQQPLSAPPSPPLAEAGTLPTGMAYIGAVGLVEPASEAIAIGTNLPGIVTRVAVRPGMKVQAGDLLWLVDDRTYRSNLSAAQADLQAAEARLRELEAQVPQAVARVESAEAARRQLKVVLDLRLDQLRRSEAVGYKGAVATEELNTRRFEAEAAAARLLEADANLREAKAALELLTGPRPESETGSEKRIHTGPTIAVQRAAIEKARATLTQAEVQLELCSVRAPVDSTVLQVRVRAGEYAPTAVLQDPLMVLGVLSPLHVRAEIDEAEIDRFNPGATAYASLRGQSGKRAKLQFLRVEPLVIPKRVLSGTVSERVDTRVLQVIYALHPGELEAMPGQQVDLYIEETSGSRNAAKP